jgi:hypothetical protein
LQKGLTPPPPGPLPRADVDRTGRITDRAAALRASHRDMTGSDDTQPLTPAQARMVARVRWLMLISGFATVLGIAVVLGVVGYRTFRSAGTSTAGATDVIVLLPKGAKIVATAAAGDALIVTIEIGGTTEIRSFDARTLAPLGRLRFATEP